MIGPTTEMPRPFDPKDTLVNTTTVHLGWWDRLRVLFGAPFFVRVEVDTEHVVGFTRTRSEAWVRPLAYHWRRWFSRPAVAPEDRR